MSQFTPRASTRQVALGLFIVGQLLFVFARNGVDLIEEVRKALSEKSQDQFKSAAARSVERLAPGWLDNNSHLHHFLETVDRTTKAYAQATEQLQSWSLFPSVGRECVFPALRIYWDETAAARKPGLKNPLALMAAPDPLQALGMSALLGSDPDAEKSPLVHI